MNGQGFTQAHYTGQDLHVVAVETSDCISSRITLAETDDPLTTLTTSVQKHIVLVALVLQYHYYNQNINQNNYNTNTHQHVLHMSPYSVGVYIRIVCNRVKGLTQGPNSLNLAVIVLVISKIATSAVRY